MTSDYDRTWYAVELRTARGDQQLAAKINNGPALFRMRREAVQLREELASKGWKGRIVKVRVSHAE